MRRRSLVTGLVVTLCLAMSILIGGSTAFGAARDINSYNWTGYAVRGPVMDAIVLEFTVPAVTCTKNNQALSIWTGFGGLTEKSLVQGGVQVRCEGTNPRYALFQQLTNGTGASTEGPQVSPGDYVRVVVCPARSGTTTGVCVTGAPSSANVLTSVAVKRGGVGDYQVWTESLTPQAWVNTRAEAECIAERPRDAATLTLLDAPQFTVPAMRCLPYRTVAPVARVNIAQGGDGFSAYRLTMVPGSPDAPRSGSGSGDIAPGRLAEPTVPDDAGVSLTGRDNPFEDPQVSSVEALPTDLPIGGSPVMLAP